MASIRITYILLFWSFVMAGNAQAPFRTDTVLWSTIDEAVLVGSGLTIHNNTDANQTIHTHYLSKYFAIAYNGRDTLLHRTYVYLSPFLYRPVNSFELPSNSYVTISPKENIPADAFVFANARDVSAYDEDRRLGIISSYIEAAVCAMVLMMTLYTIGKYVQLRTQVYLYYSLYLLFTFLFLLVVLLYTSKHLIQMPLTKGYLHHLLQSVSHACYFQFVRYFIQTRQHQPLFDKLLNWASVLSLGYVIVDGLGMLLFPQSYPYRTVWDGVQVFYLIFGVASLVIWIAHSPNVLRRYLVAGSTSLLVGGVAGLLLLFLPDWLESFPVPFNIQVLYYRLGVVVEIVCFSLGLGYMQHLDEISHAQDESRLEQEKLHVLNLKELDTLKSKFFSNITHEFRTPLTLIQGPARELYQKEKDPESKKLLSLISSNSERLLKLINQLLDLAKLESSEMKLNLTAVNLASLINVTGSQFASLAASKRIDYQVQAESDMPVVLADDEKLEAMISNLLSNAIKFTDSGGRIRVNAFWSKGRFVVRVSDTGKGIPTEKLERIFDRFYQVNPTDSSHSEGTGIGLALVKEYTELMKGVLEVESKVGLGTVFQIKLQLQVTNQPQIEPSIVRSLHESTDQISNNNKTDLDQNDERPHVLLVEDTEDIRTFIKTCLGNEFKYTEARHGREGLSLALNQIPDLIISDLMMPEMDGLELCSHLKKDTRTDHVPFIMLTAKASDENKVEGLLTGADDYLIKPFNKTELLLKVRNLITLRKNLQSHIRNTLLTEATPIQAKSNEEQFILKARLFVEEHLKDENLSVETLAHEMNLSREQCYRKIIALTGLAPSVFIRKIKLQRASQLLRAKWGTVSQVAYETGFENLSYFSKAFKEEFGKLPSEV